MANFVGYVLGVLVVIWLILIIVAPLIEFVKIVLFMFVRKEHKIELNSTIEYAYFIIAFFVPWYIVTTNCCACFVQTGITPKVLKQKVFILTFVWIAISVVYTHFTRNDIGNIPMSCPSNYPYPVQKLRLACIIRTTNFIIMWIYTSLVTMFSIAVLAGVLPSEEAMKKSGKDFNIKTIIEGV